MTAIANPGYTFLNWKSPTLIPTPVSSASVTINVTGNEPFTAYFNVNPGAVSTLEANLDLHVFPSPFVDDFTVTYSLTAASQVSVKLLDIVGKEVAVLVSPDHLQKAGKYEFRIDAKNYSLMSGVYFIKFTTGGFSRMVKVVNIGQ